MYGPHLFPARIYDFSRIVPLSSELIQRERSLYAVRISKRCGPIRGHPFEEEPRDTLGVPELFEFVLRRRVGARRRAEGFRTGRIRRERLNVT